MTQRAIGYIRVSMLSNDALSPELQLTAIGQHCARHGYVLVESFEDLDRTGRLWKRRKMEQAVRMVEQGDADVIVTWKWSRIARNRLDWALAVHRVESAGGRLESATEPVDATSTTGRLTRGVLAEIAAFEAERAADVWREIQERRIRNGLPIDGKPRFGYVRSGEGYVIDPETGPILRSMYRRRIRGQSAGQVGKWLTGKGILGPNPDRVGEPRFRGCSVDAVLGSGFGAGLLRRNGGYVPGAQPAVITRREWNAFLAIGPRARKPPLTKSDFALHGLVWCVCGRSMVPVSNGDQVEFRCYDHEGIRYRKAGVGVRFLDGAVRGWLAELAADEEVGLVAKVWADGRAGDARALARRASAGEAVADELDCALAESRCGDPQSLAGVLLADWGALDIVRRRSGLQRLIRRIDVRTGRDRTIRITARWVA